MSGPDTPPQPPLSPDLVQVPINPPTGSVFSFTVQPRHVMVHQVFDYELEALRDSSPSLPLTFFGITFGTAIAFGLGAIAPVPSGTWRAAFIALAGSSFLLSLFFAARAFQAWRKNRRVLQVIRERQT